MRKRTSIAAIALSVLMMLSAIAVYADATDFADNANEEAWLSVDANGVVRTIGTKGVGFQRVKDLQGKGTITASSTTTPDYIKAEVTAQKLNRTTNTYYDYDDPITLTSYNSSDLTDVVNVYVASSGTYRLKVVFSEKDGSKTTTSSPKYSSAVGL